MLRSKANHKSSHQGVNSGSSNVNGSPTKSRRTNSNLSSLSSVNLTTKTNNNNNNNSIHRFVIFVILVTVTIMIAFPQLVRHEEESDAHFHRGSQQHQLKLRHDYSYKYSNNNNDHNIDHNNSHNHNNNHNNNHNIISNKTNDSIPRGRFKFGISLEDAKAIKIRDAQLEKDKILENER
jgi:hypothetical protein